MARWADIGTGRCRDVQRIGARLELQEVDALVLIEGMGHRGQTDPAHVPDLLEVRRLDVEHLPVRHTGGSRGDIGPRAFEKVRRGEDLSIAMAILGVVLRRRPVGTILAAACAQHSGVRQEHRRCVVAAVDVFGSQSRPFSCSGIPELRRMDRIAGGQVVEALADPSAASSASRHQHGAVGQDGGVVLAPAKVH